MLIVARLVLERERDERISTLGDYAVERNLGVEFG